MKADIGVIGLAVMGENLVMNMESKGFSVAVYNRTVQKVEAFTAGRARGKRIYGAASLDGFLSLLKPPRRVMLMVKAGQAVDLMIDELLLRMEKGDVIIDGGNSHFLDTQRRMERVEAQGLHYIGCGVSGGEEGALKGPSMMPGGSEAAWPLVRDIFQSICAKVEGGAPCCDFVGRGGAGHFVKMVHNGIEYGDMQLICEAYQFMRDGLSMSAGDMQAAFARYNKGVLDSYLIEITRDILGFADDDGEPIINHILDAAGQKGTGKWTVNAALEEGTPLTMISEAVFARFLSAKKDERMHAARLLAGPPRVLKGDVDAFVSHIESALYASKIVSYAQGFALLKDADSHYGWNLNFGSIALLWRGGCIIRSSFLSMIERAFFNDPKLSNLMLDPFFLAALKDAQEGWRRVIAGGVIAGIPMSAMSAALAYYDGYRTENLPANLLQAQRDYFGAHTYERTDAPRGQFFHTNWTGEGGDTAATNYNA